MKVIKKLFIVFGLVLGLVFCLSVAMKYFYFYQQSSLEMQKHVKKETLADDEMVLYFTLGYDRALVYDEYHYAAFFYDCFDYDYIDWGDGTFTWKNEAVAMPDWPNSYDDSLVIDYGTFTDFTPYFLLDLDEEERFGVSERMVFHDYHLDYAETVEVHVYGVKAPLRYALSDNWALTSVRLPYIEPSYDDLVFYNCENLTSIVKHKNSTFDFSDILISECPNFHLS